MQSATRVRWWAVAATAWPILVVSASYIWPGPERPEEMYRYFERPAYAPISPPVDTLGVRGELTVSDAEGSARIFWTQPEAGRVELTIEVPPEK